MRDDEVAEVYRRYGSLVLRRCKRILREDAAAQDALQEVFLRLWRYGENFSGADSKLAWLYRVADRCCFDLLARKRGLPEVALDSATGVSGVASMARQVEDREIVMQFLARFDDRLKRVAVLHYLDEMSQEEIAATTGWSRQTVFKKLLFLRERARALRSLLHGGATT